MIKLEIKFRGTKVEYEGEPDLLESKVLPMLEALDQRHNAAVKKDLLESLEGLQSNQGDLEASQAEMSRINLELIQAAQEFTSKLSAKLEAMRTKIKTVEEFQRSSKEMQEMSQSFNLQYLQLQQNMQNENRQFTLVSNIMKTKHDTARNAINNVR